MDERTAKLVDAVLVAAINALVFARKASMMVDAARLEGREISDAELKKLQAESQSALNELVKSRSI